MHGEYLAAEMSSDPNGAEKERVDLLKHSVNFQVETGYCSQVLLSIALGIAAWLVDVVVL
jgi:hypothetical protein